MKNKLSLALSFALIMALLTSVTALAATQQIYYTGQGFTFDGTTWSINSNRCGLATANDGGTGQFTGGWPPPSGTGNYQSGDPYMVWVLTLNATPSGGVMLKGGPFGAGVAMYQVGGTWKYASLYYSPDVTIGVVFAEFDNAGIKASVLKNVQLTVSHGCPPREGGWCSPGFWRNAQDGAWQAAGFADKATGMAALFNNTVVPNYYATANSNASLTIGTVLTDTGGPGGANKYGGPDDPFGLNAFNATGAFLTDQLVGGFDPSKVGVEGACQIDHFGNYK